MPDVSGVCRSGTSTATAPNAAADLQDRADVPGVRHLVESDDLGFVSAPAATAAVSSTEVRQRRYLKGYALMDRPGRQQGLYFVFADGFDDNADSCAFK